VEHTATKRNQTKEISEEKFSLSSLLLKGRNFTILMTLVSLWFIFDITHGFGKAPPYPSEWIVEKELLPIDYWAIVGIFASLISIWAVRRLCLLQKQFYDWAIRGERYPHLIEYFQENYWVNIFKIFRSNKTTLLSLAIFLIVSVLVSVLWVADPPSIGFLGGIGFFEANDLVAAVFFPIFMVLFVLRPYRHLLANLRTALLDFNEEARTLKSSPIAESRAPIIDLVFLGKNKLVNPLDSDKLLGLEPYRDYMHQVFTLALVFLVPDLIFFGLQWTIWGNIFFETTFGVLALIHLVALIYSYVVGVSCCGEMRHSKRQVNELLNNLLGASVESGQSQPALMSAQTYLSREVKLTVSEWRKSSILVVKIAIPVLAAFPQFWNIGMEPVLRILKGLAGE
jgi:hypothetical protein